MTPERSTARPFERYVAGVRRTYEAGGPPRTLAAAASHLARRLLPHPYDTQTRIRIELLEEALTTFSSSPLPPGEHLQAYARGFDARQHQLYGLGRPGATPDVFLSRYARKCARSINEDATLLKDKDRFHAALEEHGFGHRLPRRYGTVREGRFEPDGTGDGDLTALGEREGRFVLKEAIGGGGNAVYIGTLDGGELVLQGKGGATHPAETVLADLDRAVVTAYAEQAGYADAIYPQSANTIRALTMDPPDDDPFIAAAAHRIGTSATRPLDNFSQGSGGLSAAVDLDSGELSAGATMSDWEVVRYVRHPETDGRIQGVHVPGWSTIEEEILAMTDALPGVRYVGWDVIVTGSGEFVVVEGNHYPGPAVHQVHQPLLQNPDVRAFYEHHRIPI